MFTKPMASMVEALGSGNCIIADGTPENLEVVSYAGLIYLKNDIDDLTNLLHQVMADPTLVEQ